MVTDFGKPTQVITAPGLRFKHPLQIEARRPPVRGGGGRCRRLFTRQVELPSYRSRLTGSSFRRSFRFTAPDRFLRVCETAVFLNERAIIERLLLASKEADCIELLDRCTGPLSRFGKVI
jgi:hypothetical protein